MTTQKKTGLKFAMSVLVAQFTLICIQGTNTQFVGRRYYKYEKPF